MTTVKDVAKLAGVSSSSVSAVFNGKAASIRIKNDTIRKIRECAARLGYHPNHLAKSLRRGRTCTIGILLPVPRENIYADFIGAFEHALGGTEYSAIYGFWDTIPAASGAIANVIGQQVDGVITVEPDLIPEQFTGPVVSLFSASDRFDSFGVDWTDAFRQAVVYLKSLGHRRIARVDCSSADTRRSAAFRTILEDEGLSTAYLTELLPTTKLMLIESGIGRVIEWHKSLPDPPSAYIMPNDASSLALIGALVRNGINVPRQVSVIGMDNVRISSWLSPALTTFDFASMGSIPALAVSRLLERIRNPDLPVESVLLRASMLVRDSTWHPPE